MPDGSVSVPDVESDIDFTIQAACECYSCYQEVQAALGWQDSLNGGIAWAPPRAPDPESLIEDADLVLVVTDTASLSAAKERLAGYQALQQAVLLIHLVDDEQAFSNDVPGLAISRLELLTGLNRLVRTLVAPVIRQGLVCVDWADMRHILALDGPVLIEDAFGSQPEEVIVRVINQLRVSASGHPVQGMQASISFSQSRLRMRQIHELASACKEVMGEDGLLILAAPSSDRPDSGACEIRIFAKLDTAEQQEP